MVAGELSISELKKEREFVAVQVDEESAAAIFDRGWQDEKMFKSSELAVIRGLSDNKPRGSLIASFVIRREFDEESSDFREKDRLVDLKSVSVWPRYQREGLGTAMITELERVARRFGASAIRGTLSAIDLEEKPWLAKFYRERGFELEPKGAGFKLSKRL